MTPNYDHCGACRKWMVKHLCKREVYNRTFGSWDGPSCDTPSCNEYESKEEGDLNES